MKKVITLEIGNSSWWKNKKYRKEAAKYLIKMRIRYRIKLKEKYHLPDANTILYANYEIFKKKQ
tara:strand:- start:21 stop:212 length:192 start_codon:yes stop_codon:yes gene_type:complete